MPRVVDRVPGAVVDPLLEALAFWLMAKDPAERPQTAAEVAAVLDLIEADPTGAEALLAPWIDPRFAAEPPGDVPAAIAIVSLPGQESRTSRRWIAAAMLVIGAIGLFAALGGDDEEPAAPVAQVAPAAPTPIPTPSPETETETETATATVVPKPKAKPRRPSPASPPPSVKSPEPPPPPPKPATAATTPDRETFTALYRRVGTDLDAHRKAHGEDATAALSARYRSIAYLDAVRKPELRAAALRELEAIARKLR